MLAIPPPVELTLDRDGGWLHEGRPITHPRLVRLLNRHLVVSEDGRVEIVVPCGERVERGVVTVLELPYVVTWARTGDPLRVRLNDEQEEDLSPEALWLVGDARLYARVKGGRFPARLLRVAYLAVASVIEPRSGGGWVLHAGERVVPLRQEARPPEWPPGGAP